MVFRFTKSILITLIVIIISLFASRLQFFSQRLFGVSLTRRANITASKMTPVSSTGKGAGTGTGTGSFAGAGAAGISTAATAFPLFDQSKPETPVFFFSHGGPTFMYPDADFGGDSGAYKEVKSIGKYIQSTIKPKFIVVISAHWQSNSDKKIEIGVPNSYGDVFNSKTSSELLDPQELDLIYDFYGFPDYMYKEKFHSKGSIELANDIHETLTSNSIDSKITPRGIDHGVWVPFKVAFSSNKPEGKEWDLDCPLVQVSLSASDDFDFHHKLGQALSKYRKLGGVIICSGMSVHNLRDFGLSISQGGKTLTYVPKLNKLLTIVISENKDDERLKKLKALQTEEKQLLYRVHPSLEHFMPIVVASGAGKGDKAQELYNNSSFSLGWGVYKFGDYNKEK